MIDLDFNTPMDAPVREHENQRKAAQELIDEMFRRSSWQWRLAHNLAVAAGLCKAFDLGWDECVDATNVCGTYPGCGRVRGPHWQPGCGKAAP